jgi:hypothetical protein
LLNSNGLFAQAKYTITNAFNFPTKPGTQAWADLSGHRERVLACELPITIAKSMTTASLVETCMNYPLRINLALYDGNTDLTGSFFNNFYGFKELALREDTGTHLLEAYKRFSKQSLLKPAFELDYIYINGLIQHYTALFTVAQKQNIVIHSLRDTITVSDSPAHNNLIIIPLRLGLYFIIEENISLTINGAVIDKNMLPFGAFKYWEVKSFSAEEKNWCGDLIKTLKSIMK